MIDEVERKFKSLRTSFLGELKKFLPGVADKELMIWHS
jgi:hypothetical protein